MSRRPGADPSDRVRFVLVAPQSAGNVGASARALKNLGFHRLVLVAPACEPASLEARSFAVDAADLLAEAVVAPDLACALDGAATVVGTTRRTGKQRHPHYRFDEVSPELARLARAGDLAVVFGCEPHGLSDEDLDRCTHLVHFLAAPEYPSFNLAQAVLLAAYELRRVFAGECRTKALGAVADDATREAMYTHLHEALLAADYLSGEMAEGKMRRIRRILGRAALTPGDTRIFRGIARQILWLSGRAGREP